MNIQLSGYLYYLNFILDHFQQDDLNLKMLLLDVVKAIEIAKIDNLLAKLRQLTRYDYETLMFPVQSVDSAKAAIVYYLILQVFNHRHHQQAKLYTQGLIQQLLLASSTNEILFNIPRQLINNLKNFYAQADGDLRKEIINFLQDMKSKWNSYFFYELEFMFLVWENEKLSPHSHSLALASDFSGMKGPFMGERPEQLAPYTLYCYQLDSRLYYAFKTWDGIDCYDQLCDRLDETQLDNPSYWYDTFQQNPPFIHLKPGQDKLVLDLKAYLDRHTQFNPAEIDSFRQKIQHLQADFYHINFLLIRANSVHDELYNTIEQIQLVSKNLFKMNVLLLDFTDIHQNMIEILTQIQDSMNAVDKKKSSWPPVFQASLETEMARLKQEFAKQQDEYSNFRLTMLEVFNQAHNFSFLINDSPEIGGSVLRHALWSLGLCLSAGVGLTMLVTSTGMSLGLGFGLYFIFTSAALVGLALGAKAFYLALVHADRELANQKYEVLPSWNSPIPK